MAEYAELALARAMRSGFRFKPSQRKPTVPCRKCGKLFFGESTRDHHEQNATRSCKFVNREGDHRG